MSEENDDYRNRMDPAVEELAMALACDDELTKVRPTTDMMDHEIVYFAAAKIRTLKKLLLSAGLTQGIIDAVLTEVQSHSFD